MRYILASAAWVSWGVSSAWAGAVETSLRPMARDAVPLIESISASAVEVARSLRPVERPETNGSFNSLTRKEQAFQSWISGFKDRARALGLSKAVLDAAFDAVRYDPEVIRRDRNQSEFTKTIWDYLDSAASDVRISNGKSALAQHARTLSDIEARYNVEAEVIVAIWGLESAYGSFRGRDPVIQSLATLAFDGRRGAFFEKQLVAALTILQSGDTTAQNMTGSWAGAMGHTQFMPTSYLDYAVDFGGDGRRDIWSNDPTDALASTAAYLAKFGWTKGQPWGVEVKLPPGFNYTMARRDITRTPSAWARMGVTDMNGNPVPDHGPASVLLPAGGSGAAFLVFENFSVIERYNSADAYVIGVGHLSDRLAGAPPILATWPRSDRALTYVERKELQRLLTQAGFDTKKIDGKIGPLTTKAVRGYQLAHGLKPDGYASLDLLKKMR